ncbi:MAG: hypothetical protein POELPBGB_00814 [Bacteroidia bacterium]|nr:hypothetical protein [Bacteroidia bacterium]
MIRIRKNKTFNLTVDFYKVDSGCLFYKLTLGKRTFDNVFSAVYDPIIDFKNWLEAISVGVKQCSFEFDTEGSDVRFDFNRVSWDKEVLTISDPSSDYVTFIKGSVNRKQIVEAFYQGLLSFAASDKFISKEWEVEYIHERLSKALNWSKEKQIIELCKLDRTELAEVLFNADPSYIVSFPAITDKNEAIKLFVREAISEKENETIEKVLTPDEWKIPDDYDYWQPDKKEIYVRECLDQPTDGNGGTKIQDFRSEIIEKFLVEE